MYDLGLLKRMVKDIRALLGSPEPDEDIADADHVGLWDERIGEVAAGKSYADDEWDEGKW